MGVHRLVHRAHHVEVGERKERQIQHVERLVLARVVGGAEDRGLKRSQRDPVEVLLALRELLAVEELDGELAAGTLGGLGGHVLRALREGPALAPERHLPVNLGALHHLGGGGCDAPGEACAGGDEGRRHDGEDCLSHRQFLLRMSETPRCSRTVPLSRALAGPRGEARGRDTNRPRAAPQSNRNRVPGLDGRGRP